MSDREDLLVEEWVRKKLYSGKRPPWRASDRRDRKWMEAWVIEQINAAEEREVREMLDEIGDDYPAWEARTIAAANRESALLDASRADFRALLDYVRELDPALVPHIDTKRKQGQRKHPPRSPYEMKLPLACHYVYAIRDLWAEKFRKKKRHRDMHPTAVEIAAEICGVDADDVEGMLKKFPRRRPMKKVPRRI